MRFGCLLLLSAVLLGGIARPGAAQSTAPVYNPANGHWYQYVRLPGRITWPDAKAAAESVSYAGFPGHLATVTSAEENRFLSNFLTATGPLGDIWIGGYQDHSARDYSEPASGWRWVTGEPWSYTSWSGGEPNNAGGGEDALETNSGGTWNDLPTLAGVGAYVIEYEPTPINTGPLLSFSPNPIVGGQPATGQLILAQAAGLGGTIVTLTSSNPAAAVPPAVVVVPPGTNSLSFPVVTFAVASTTPVTITATYAGGIGSGTLQILPGPSSTPSPSLPPGHRAAGPPVYNPANGHWYQAIITSDGLNFYQAEGFAAGLLYSGLSGHLVTITSEAEQQFVASRLPVSQQQYWWMGAYQDKTAPDYREPGGGWRWVTGEPFGPYTHWYPGQPDNDGNVWSNGENALEFDAKLGNWWNDYPEAIPIHGYIVEYESPATVTPAPTPVPAGSTQIILFPNPALGGQPVLGQVVLSQPSGPGGVVVTLTSSNPAAAAVPATVTIPPGSVTATFLITTFPVAAPTPVSITVGCSFGSATAVLQLLPAGITPTGPMPTGFRLLVSSHDNSSVLAFDGQTGTFISPLVRSGSGGLQCTHDLAIGPDGNLYVSSRCTNSILRYNGQTGDFIGTFVPPGSGGLDTPIGLVFGPDGDLYVSSYGTDSVLHYDGRTGAFLSIFVGARSGGLKQPYGLLFGLDGRLYVCSEGANSVLRYDGRTGAFIDAFVPAGSGGLSAAHGLDFGPDGDLYVSGWRSNNVLRYDGHTGTFRGVFVPAGSGGLALPFGVTFGPDGNLYVANFGTNSVLRYDGRTGAFLGAFAAGNGLNGPTWLLFVPTGRPSVNLLANGSFEQPAGGGFGVGSGLPGWRILTGTVDVLPVSYWQPSPDGGQNLDLVGTPGAATIDQSFPTIPGQEYLFSGWISHNVEIDQGRANVFLNDLFFVQLFHSNDLYGKATVNEMRWQPFSYRFRATGPTTDLKLTDVTNLWDAGGGILLDGLSVVLADGQSPPVVNPPAGLAAPLNLTATMATEARVRLAWTDASGAETGFAIWRKGGSSDWTRIGAVPANTTTFTDAGVSPSTLYTYRVQATSDNAVSPWSNEASLTTPAAPAAPFSLTATAAGPNLVALAWSVNPSNSTAVELYRKGGGADWRLIAVLGPGSTGYQDRGVTPGASYTYRVRAANDYFASGWSNEASATTAGGM